MIVALSAACGSGGGGGGAAGDEPPRLRATVVRPEPDTIHFSAPAAALSCSDGRSLLLQGAGEHGNGVLVRLRYSDSLGSGAFPLIALGDSVTPRGANVGVRYMKGDVAHGLALDSGGVDLTASGDALAARVRGSGLESGVRVAVDAAFAGVPLPSSGDTVPCRFQP